MNKLQAIGEESEAKVSYYEMVKASVNTYNKMTSRFNSHTYYGKYQAVTIHCNTGYTPYNCYGSWLVARVDIKHGSHIIASASTKQYQEHTTKEKAFDELFQEIFDTISMHGIDNLVNMYNQAYRYTHQIEVDEYKRHLGYGNVINRANLIPTDSDEDFRKYLNLPPLLHNYPKDAMDTWFDPERTLFVEPHNIEQMRQSPSLKGTIIRTTNDKGNDYYMRL